MNKISEKIKKGSKIGQIISTAMIIILAIICAFFAVYLIISAVKSDENAFLSGVPIALMLFTAIFVLWNLRVAFKAIQNSGTPFIPIVPKKLKLIGWLMIAVSIVRLALDLILVRVFSAPIMGTFSVGSVFAGLISIFLATMFSYGCQLQAESDQTL